MNILYIDHYAGSTTMGMEFRPFYLGKEWEKYGHNTTILAADYSHLRRENPSVNNDLEIKEIDNQKFMFLKTVKYDGNGVKRILSMFDFLRKGILNARKISEIVKPDIVICSSTYPLDTYIGQRIKKITGAKLFHEIHDLWPLSPMELGGYSKNHPFIRIMQMAENSAYKNSDSVVSILPNTEPYIRSLGFNVPVYPIPNGLLESAFEEAEKEEFINKDVKKIVDKLHSEYKFVVGYAGGISVSNAMDDFIKAMIEIKSDNSICSVIIGNGILKDELIKIKEKENLNNVIFIDGIAKKEVIPTLKLMDALYIGSKKSKLYEYGVSANKIFDYMLTGKPIINAFDSNHSPMNYLGNTIIAKAEDPKDIADAIIKSSKISNEDRIRISTDSIKFVKENHNYKNLAKKFQDLF